VAIMSAVLVDDLLVEEFLAATPVRLRLLPGGAESAVEIVDAAPAGPAARTRVSSSRPTGGSLRLTNRGIAVILGAFATLFATGVTVAVTSFLAVSDAPIPAPVVAGALR
jgi:hypothetical protein